MSHQPSRTVTMAFGSAEGAKVRLGLQLVLVSALVALTSGCPTTAPSNPAPPRPTPLADVDAFAEAHRAAARAVAASLAAQGEQPQEFYAEVEPGAGGR